MATQRDHCFKFINPSQIDTPKPSRGDTTGRNRRPVWVLSNIKRVDACRQAQSRTFERADVAYRSITPPIISQRPGEGRRALGDLPYSIVVEPSQIPT